MPQKKGPPQIIKLEKALKLAELWVSNMSKPVDDEPSEVEVEDRPHRLGLGARVSRQIKPGPSSDPVERKLRAKLGAGKRKASQSMGDAVASVRDAHDDDSDDDDLESRSSAFAKKKTAPPASLLHAKRQK